MQEIPKRLDRDIEIEMLRAAVVFARGSTRGPILASFRSASDSLVKVKHIVFTVGDNNALVSTFVENVSRSLLCSSGLVRQNNLDAQHPTLKGSGEEYSRLSVDVRTSELSTKTLVII